MPRVFSSFEETLKSIVQDNISRGKVDVFITIDSSNSDDMMIKVNSSLAESYVKALRQIALDNGIKDDVRVTDITRFPDVLSAEKCEVDSEQLCADISEVLKSALIDFNKMRAREGEKLQRDMTARLEEIIKLTDVAEELSPKVAAEYRKKLELRMSEILESTTIDEDRILTEAAIFADKTAINEEIVRLRSHISQLKEFISENEPVGRKIDFLIQEFNREANTIGSKGNDTEMSKVVVNLKAEIEKIREQVQNIE